MVAPAEGTTASHHEGLYPRILLYFSCWLESDGGPNFGKSRAGKVRFRRCCKALQGASEEAKHYGFRSFAAVQHEGLALWTEVSGRVSCFPVPTVVLFSTTKRSLAWSALG